MRALGQALVGLSIAALLNVEHARFQINQIHASQWTFCLFAAFLNRCSMKSFLLQLQTQDRSPWSLSSISVSLSLQTEVSQVG
jgi:hypothetical protein